MPVLHLDEVPSQVYERLQQLAAAHQRTLEEEAVRLLHRGWFAEPGSRSQAELLDDLRRRSFVPPPATPESIDLVREDWQR